MDIGTEDAKQFVAELWRSLERSDCPTKLNVVRRFRDYIVSKYLIPQAIAEEEARKLQRSLLTEIERRATDWELSGVPRPVASVESEDFFVTWSHRRYQDLTGLTALPVEFAGVTEWLSTLSPRGFLVPCVIFLRTLGASRIFVTDGPNDEGVDIIARIGQGGLKSTALFCQVKTHGKHIGKDHLLLEYGKYLALPHTEKYQRYREALEVDRSVDGSSYIYVFMTNQGFAIPARQIARSLGILIRSRIQIAHSLIQYTTVDGLREVSEAIGREPPADISKNLADSIPEF